jgi:hypothetical protein
MRERRELRRMGRVSYGARAARLQVRGRPRPHKLHVNRQSEPYGLRRPCRRFTLQLMISREECTIDR